MIKKEFIGWSIFGSYYRFVNYKLALIVWLIDRLGYILFVFRRRSLKKVPKSILIIQLDHIGDMIINSSLIKAIKNEYPDATITVLIRSLARPVAEIINEIDTIQILHTPWLSREKHSGWLGVFSFCLKHFKTYDLTFEVHGELRNNFLAWMLGKFRCGTGIRGGGFFLNKSIQWNREYDLHISEMQTRMLSTLTGKKLATLPPTISIPLTVKTKISETLKKELIPENQYVLVQMSPGAKNREWPVTYWKELLQKLTDSKIHVVCADLDLKKIKESSPDSPYFHHMSVSLVEYFELVRIAKLIISVETFCGHAAACFQKPTVSIYSGVVAWEEWRPYNKNVEYIQNTTCTRYPCGKHHCFFGYYSPCMKNIKVDDVYQLFCNVLDRI